MANCLVLGANGFIGSHLVDALAEDGHFVRCFDRYKTGDVIFSNHAHHDTEIMRGDFLSTASLEAALDNMDYVFHFISTTTPLTAENDPVFDLETNVRMSVELFKLCSEKGVKKLIFASTGGAIYGNVDAAGPLSEKVCPKPISPYAIGKFSIENYLRYFKTKHNLPYAVLRISNPYGPRLNTLSGQGVIPIFLEKIRDNKPITIFGDGSMIRDYVYVEDIACLIAKSFEKQSNGSVYNLGAGEGCSINQLVEIIKKVTGVEPIIESRPTPPTFVQSVVLDTTKFFNDFDIKPDLVKLEDGIKKTWQYLNQK